MSGDIEGSDEFASQAGRQIKEGQMANSLTTTALTQNMLLLDPASVNELIHRPLLETIGSPGPVQHALDVDVYSRQVVRYLIHCALRSDQSVWVNGVEHFGNAGLHPDWLTQPGQDELALQRVSGCLAAVNNPQGFTVPLLLLGAGLDDRSPAIPFHKDLGGNLIDSLAPCTGDAGENDDCGWREEGLLACRPGTTVQVSAGGFSDSCEPLGKNKEAIDTVLRVVAGTSAADAGPDTIYADDSGRKECRSKAPYVEFKCKPKRIGLVDLPWGVYSVMTATRDRQGSPDGVVIGVRSSDSDRPARMAVRASRGWPLHEGASYGQMFHSGQHRYRVRVDEASGRIYVCDVASGSCVERTPDLVLEYSPYAGLFHCSSDVWAQAEMYEAERRCVGGKGLGCVGEYVGACWEHSPESKGSAYPEFRCLSAEMTPNGIVVPQDCLGQDGRVYKQAISSFLSTDCAFGQAECELSSTGP